MDINSLKLSVDEESVSIFFENGLDEDPDYIVFWCKNEWMEDPEIVVPAIINAINLYYTDKKRLLNLLEIEFE